jgi:hypothetical protein
VIKRGILALALLGACHGTGGSSAPDAPSTEDVTVTAFDGTHVYFTGSDNQRQIDAPVHFPAPGQHYKQVTLHLSLACPQGGCDPWDRLAHLSIVDGDHEIEIARFITPYHVGADFTVDVTDLQRLLDGDLTMRVFIDTWVGPGSPYGAGWLVNASFEFVGGEPARDPFAVIALWGPHAIVYGDPAQPTAQSTDVTVPAGTTGARLRALVTGHGQGNADNCAEFCDEDHTFDVGGAMVSKHVWRDDCATTAAPNQEGTYQYPRSGWCPGAMVEPWTADVDVAPGALTVGYDIASYENTCRPGVATCTGCTLGTGCDYDGGNHTEPSFQQSALLILYR